jgi:hypothetical protein
MKKLLILTTTFILSCQADQKTDCNYITHYYQTIYEADLEFEIQNYEKAFYLYQDAFKSCEAKNTTTYNEIARFTEISAMLKKFDITYKYAKKQVLKGVELNQFENNEIFNEFLTSDFGQKFISEYNNLREVFETNANFKLRDELIAMRVADQMYRGGNGEANWMKQDSIDKIHEVRLIEIFETLGYPTEKLVGPNTKDNYIDIGLFMLHTDDSIRMNYFVPKIKEFVINGTASPRILGTMIDQYYLYNGEPQIYGTYQAQGGGYATMIDDLKKVDRNRLSIGLPPLELKEKKDSLIKAKYGF